MNRLLPLGALAVMVTLVGCQVRAPADPPSPPPPGDEPAVADLVDVHQSGDDGVGPEDEPVIEPPPGALALTLMTFNVRRFFDTVCDTGSCGQGQYEAKPSVGVFQARADQIADALTAVDGDIVLLQEVETQVCLDALIERLGDTYPVAILGEIGSPASVDVAVLAPGEVLGIHRHRDKPIPLLGGGITNFSREFLEVHLAIGGWRVIVFVAHFKSKANDDPERRLAEAMAARAIILNAVQEHPEALVILGGDLNDTPGSDPLDALEGDGGLARVASDMPQGADWTYRYFGEQSALDHIYLATEASGAYTAGSTTIFRDPGGGYGGSDHAAVRAGFSVGP